MPREFIGVIISADTGEVVAVINPDDDSELDNPRLLQIEITRAFSADYPPMVYTSMTMIKVPRGEYTGTTLTLDQLGELVERFNPQ